ncbi:MAG TPA: HepT-like ribonuclease domain-containing protein [Ilumatobacteraceae bacterium]
MASAISPRSRGSVGHVLPEVFAEGEERGDAALVCRGLSVAIESVAMIDDVLRARAYGDVWPAILSVRNWIAHGYLVVDRTIIMATVDNDLGEFEERLSATWCVPEILPGATAAEALGAAATPPG